MKPCNLGIVSIIICFGVWCPVMRANAATVSDYLWVDSNPATDPATSSAREGETESSSYNTGLSPGPNFALNPGVALYEPDAPSFDLAYLSDIAFRNPSDGLIYVESDYNGAFSSLPNVKLISMYETGQPQDIGSFMQLGPGHSLWLQSDVSEASNTGDAPSDYIWVDSNPATDSPTAVATETGENGAYNTGLVEKLPAIGLYEPDAPSFDLAYLSDIAYYNPADGMIYVASDTNGTFPDVPLSDYSITPMYETGLPQDIGSFFDLGPDHSLWMQSDVNETPLPAALPLFVSGLGYIALFARCFRKKVVAP